jgi:PBP1b-binding outer membrane lipoprotein LpoB
MKYIMLLITALLFIGCSATARGVKEDSKNAAEWTKQKVNEAATAVKEKTE